VAAFLFVTPTGYYRPWQYDAGNRAVMERIAASGSGSPAIAAPSTLMQGLEFYRRKPGFNSWPAITEYKEGVQSQFVIHRTDESPHTPPSGMTPIWRDSVSGIVLYGR